MEWMEAFKDVNYWAVLVAVVSTFAVGMAWYSNGVFGKTWLKEIGKKEADMKSGMGQAMMFSGVAMFFAATVMSALLIATGTIGAVDSAVFGAVVGFGVAMCSLISRDSFSRVSMKLTKINGLFDVVKFAVMGAILGGVGF